MNNQNEMTKDGISTTKETGHEHFQYFKVARIGRRVQYDYRDHDGELFSCVGKDLADARAQRNRWLLVRSIKEGGEIVYNDGRGDAKAKVLEKNDRFMVIQFDDRASTNTVMFNCAEWMNHITAIPADEAWEVSPTLY